MKLDNYTLTVLHRSPLFRALEPDQFNALVDTAHLYTLNEGEMLFRQGDPLNEVFVNIKDFMKLFRLTPNGDEKVVDIIAPGSSFAEAVLFMGGQQYPVYLAGCGGVGSAGARGAITLSTHPPCLDQYGG